MKVIRHESPSKALGAAFNQQGGQLAQKMLSIGVVGKKVPSFDPLNDDVVLNMRDIETWLARHENKTSLPKQDNNS